MANVVIRTLGCAVLVLTVGVGLPLYAAALSCMSVNRFFLAGLGASLPHVVLSEGVVHEPHA